MRKSIITSLLLLVMTSAMAQTKAQKKDFYQVGNHVSLSVGIGILNGGTIELAAPVTRFAAIRAGYNFFPEAKISTKMDMDYGDRATQYISGLPKEIEVESKPSLSTGHILIDFYPLKRSSFHLTAGAYFGSDNIMEAYNKDEANKAILQEIYLFNERKAPYDIVPNDLGGFVGTKIDGREKIGVELGNYFLEPDNNGQINANIQVEKFRPYIGVGFGRAIPEKHRLACCFDLGVQFWGSPSVYVRDHKLNDQDLNGEDGGALKTLSEITVCPAISVRLTGRLF